jgi:hypothetical protein
MNRIRTKLKRNQFHLRKWEPFRVHSDQGWISHKLLRVVFRERTGQRESTGNTTQSPRADTTGQ